MKLDKYPWIREVVLNIEYDIGGINMMRSERDALEQAEECLFADGVDEHDVMQLDRWLGSLTEHQREVFAGGEQGEMDALAALSPCGSEGERVSRLLEMDHFL